MVKVLDSFLVSPPPGVVPTVSLRLTYFDMPWLFCPNVQRLFFYKFPHPTLYFMETTLPMLKRSLSLTLQHFFPYAANIMCPPSPGKPFIHYTDGDSVAFTVAESDKDFDHVVADYPRDVELLHPFVPQLPSEEVTEDGIRVLPVIALRVTVFPNSGICIGSTYHHTVGDGKSFMHFMRFWASGNRSGATDGDLIRLENSLPLINKDVVKDPAGLELAYLKNYWHWVSSRGENSAPPKDITSNKVRATFTFDRARAERLKQLVTTGDAEQNHISTFMVTCAFVWVSLIKSKENLAYNLSDNDDDDNKFYYFMFSSDCRNRLEFPVPTTYLGNCLRPCIVDVKRSELIGEDGIVLAAKAIGRAIKEAMRSGWEWAEDPVSAIRKRAITGRLTPTAGSPKLGVYDTDFGWGKPCKVELAHIDHDGAMSMAECRDGQGGIEVGLALNKNQMDEFVAVFEQNLKHLGL
ncbi:HXXXD-type acyl-transferase family protein, putative isoform 2 [Hibiscus syriacus]|uniref:HXXXD-type acyl-transferase family protein, putative isoform 2 n=1 Tax=Hibiscus syriacus TaxID=106335 RepID=A0A6A2WSD2_HIBSY|nr:coumaroyl-CoA:anthocyanidin 3-O-glucoside-6''-O-coumaroyltransferase 1-like [Hibiscus syriacus]KAE8664062.1 HXXXD-type acyl-transferase family protein, putative isoform 2 [Hibiscus syriacus]